MPQKISTVAIDFMLSQLQNRDRILLQEQPHHLLHKNAKAFVDIDSYKKLFLRLIKLTGNENLPFKIGRQIHINSMGILGYILENSPTLGDALENLLHYHALLSQSLLIQTTHGNRYVKIMLTTTPPEIPPLDRYSNEINLTALVTILNTLTMEQLRPQVVKFTHARPRNLDSYYPIFGRNLEFGESINTIYYPKEILAYPLKCPNATMLEFFKAQAKRILEREGGGSYSASVSKILFEMLHYKTPEIKEVAKRLNITTHTLQNRLKSEKTTFQELIVTVKKQLACCYLKNHELSIQEIARRLGYSEASAFNHAFKQWTSLTPKEFRRSKNP